MSPEFAKSNDLDNYDKIEYCRRIFMKNNNMNIYYGILRQSIIPDPEKFNNSYIPFIKDLKRIEPFPAILTTNCDLCLEHTRLFRFDRFFNNPRDFRIDNLTTGSVFHIHGSEEDFESAIFSKSQLGKFYADPMFNDLIQHVFMNNCVIFLGYGMGDRSLMDRIYEVRSKGARQPCFWLIPEDRKNDDRIRVHEENYELSIIVYGKLEQFQEVIKSWINKHFGLALSIGE